MVISPGRGVLLIKRRNVRVWYGLARSKLLFDIAAWYITSLVKPRCRGGHGGGQPYVCIHSAEVYGGHDLDKSHFVAILGVLCSAMIYIIDSVSGGRGR